MSAQSPRRGSRAFTFLLVFVLVGSMVAPIAAAGTASATTTTTATATTSSASVASTTAAGDNCLYALIGGENWCHSTPEEVTQTQLDQTEQAIMTDLHYAAVSEWESQKSYTALQENYLEDTETVASLNAKHALASAYENGSTEAEATQAARAAIREYYTTQQVQTLETFEKQAAQLRYTHNVSESHGSIDDNFVALGASIHDMELTSNHNLDGRSFDRNATTVELPLVNGSTHNVSVNEVQYTISYTTSTGTSYYRSQFLIEPFDLWTKQGDSFETPSSDNGWSQPYLTTDGVYGVMNVGNATETGLGSQKVADLMMWRNVWDDLESQANTMAANYDSEFTGDLYDALESGQIDPSDVRSAEGQVRWMSGDDEVTGDRFQLATMSVLGMANPDLTNTSTMVVDYDGYTSQSYTDSQSSRNVTYSDPVDETYQGLLFSGEVPDSGFEKGTEYSTSELNGSQVMFDEESGEEVTFAQGNFTVTEMYDSDGNEVNETSWENPEYDTYDADEFVQYTNETKVYRETIIQKGSSEEGDDLFALPDFGLPDGSGSFVGLAIIGVVVLVVVGFVMDMIPGLGN